MTDYALQVEDLYAGYRRKQVLSGVSLAVPKGEIVALLGHNGAGKSTSMKTIFGMVRPWRGKITVLGEDVTGRSPIDNVAKGIGLVPQERAIFRNMSVAENIRLSCEVRRGNDLAQREQMVFDVFPSLRSRMHNLAGTLSGGEQQMLAISMVLVRKPRVMLLDEPSVGLSPLLVTQVFEILKRINRDFGISVLVAEQNVRATLHHVNRLFILQLGSIVFSGTPQELSDNAKLWDLF